ncbi:MAG: adenylate/guanylate cyclase domain-containing protein [Polyangiales bacterium]
MAALTLVLVPDPKSGLERISVSPADNVQVGRSTRCEVRLPQSSRFVSRLHATLSHRDGVWYVSDESRLGTYLDGIKLPARELTPIHDGAKLSFGDCEFVAELAADVDSHTAFGHDGTYTMSAQSVDLTAIDTRKVLQSALELPLRLGGATSERALYGAACDYLISALAPAIATAYVALTSDDEGVKIIGRANRPDIRDSQREIMKPIVSRRVYQRLREAPESVLFLHRRSNDMTFSATVSGATRVLGASLLETDAHGRSTILYAVGDHALDEGVELVAQYMALVATLLRQHLSTLRRVNLAKYFSPNVVRLLTQRDGAAAVEGEPVMMRATSLFFDVRGSSPALDASAHELADLYADLRRVIDLVTELVFQSEGTIIDYAGDGVFAAWGVPFPQENQAELSVRCAIEILQRLNETRFKVLDQRHAVCGIGIAQGDVLAGPVGSAIVFKYGILGPSVNAAQRLATLTKADALNRPILLTATVHEQLVGTGIVTESLGTVELPGMRSRVGVYEAVLDAL